MKRRNVRTLSLIVVTFTYLLIGAAVFDALEGPHNESSFEALGYIKESFMTKYNMSEDDYKIFELLIIERRPHKNGPQWKFAGSFYYALVVLALIGYGHSTPNTKIGKAFTMGYAMLGIPMAMVMFQSMGERMNKFFSVIIKKVRTWAGCTRVDATEFDLIVASGFTSSIVITWGATMYHFQEGWSFFNSLYYSFITLSTIGFGDYVALQSDKALQMKPGYVICSFIFLLLGLASFASSVNLLVLRFMILSLEEEEQEELQDVAQNVVTLDGEVMAVNGRILAGHQNSLRGPGLFDPLPIGRRREPDVASVCSCTCYGTSSGMGSSRKAKTRSRNPSQRYRSSINAKRKNNQNLSAGNRLRKILRRIFLFGRAEENQGSDDGHYYDEETQSISNYHRHAIKRVSI